VENNQPLTPVTQSSTQLFQSGHVQTSHDESKKKYNSNYLRFKTVLCFKLCFDQALTKSLAEPLMANIFKYPNFAHVTYQICEYVIFNKCVFPVLGFPGRFPSSVEYNQLPSALARQNKGNNNSRSHTQSE